jgi:hypothetical protein
LQCNVASVIIALHINAYRGALYANYTKHSNTSASTTALRTTVAVCN